MQDGDQIFRQLDSALNDAMIILRQRQRASLLSRNRIPQELRDTCAKLIKDIESTMLQRRTAKRATLEDLLFSAIAPTDKFYCSAKNIEKIRGSLETLAPGLDNPIYLQNLADATNATPDWETFADLQKAGLLPKAFSPQAITNAYYRARGKYPEPKEIAAELLNNREFRSRLTAEAIQEAGWVRSDSKEVPWLEAAHELVAYRNLDGLTKLANCLITPRQLSGKSPEGFREKMKLLIEPLQDSPQETLPPPRQTPQDANNRLWTDTPQASQTLGLYPPSQRSVSPVQDSVTELRPGTS